METPPPIQSPAGQNPTLSERQWAIGLHLSAILGFFTPHLLNIIAPLIIWLIKKPESAYLDGVGKRVLNFQISYSLYGFIAASLLALLWWTGVGLIFAPVYGVIAIAWLVLTVFGAIKESNGESYDFPFVIRFFS